MRPPPLARRLPLPFALIALACAAPADDPAAAAKRFISLARQGDCKQAFALYTTASRQNLEAFSKKLKRNTPYETEANEPYVLHCHVFADYVTRTAKQVSRSADGDSAVVSVTQRTGSYIPIPFLSDPIKETTVTIQMAREGGAWRVAAPHIQVEDPYRHGLDVGKFTVEWARNPPTRNRGFRVSGVLDATPEAIEAVFLDFEHWPAWMPMLAESRALTQRDTQARPRRQLITAGTSPPATRPWTTSSS